MSMGMNSYLAKPVGADELVMAVKDLLTKSVNFKSATPSGLRSYSTETGLHLNIEDSLIRLGGDDFLLREVLKTFLHGHAPAG